MAWGWRQGRLTKLGNTRMTCQQGHSHRSKLEGAVCAMLHQRVLAGEIERVEVEQHIRVCGPPGHECSSATKVDYVVDFRCIRPDGSEFFVEAKGMRTAVFSIKRRLWAHHGHGRLEIWGGTYVRPRLEETIG